MKKYFKLIREGVDVTSLLAEIDGQEDAWAVNTNRQNRIGVQKHTNTIFLRRAKPRPDLHPNDNQESVPNPIAQRFPLAMKFINTVAEEFGASLSRTTIVRLKPHSEVGRHIDIGAYYFIRNRYHLVLRSPAGSVLQAGDESVRMHEGELWWFDNKQHHMAVNESNEWRIHYIFDLLPPCYAALARNPLSIEHIDHRSNQPLNV